MCGLAGFVHLDGRPLERGRDEALLGAMGDALQHRGPDDAAIVTWRNVGFVFRRLSIVDVEGGRQPFDTADGRVTAMVNGEIFNHAEIRLSLAHRDALRTRSDCEVVPWLWLERGRDLFERVNGMYAAAILDRDARRLVLARDRMGIKPLFYCVAEGGRLLVFASELKGLFAHPSVPRTFDWAYALTDPHGTNPEGGELRSGFVGIERVPAASIVEVPLDGGAIRTTRYWSLPAADPSAPVASPASYAEAYAERLEASVRGQLMSDVGFGIFLSGGLDSAVMTALAARTTRDFPTFSVFSGSTVASGDAEAAHRVAQAVGVRNHPVRFDERSLACTPDDWRRILWSCETSRLTAEQLFKFNLHAFARDRYPGLKVILLGQGSDEFTGGYVEWLVGGAEARQREQRAWGAQDLPALRDALVGIDVEHAADDARLSPRFRDLFVRRVLDPGPLRGWTGRAAVGDTLDFYRRAYRANLDHHLWHEDRTASAHGIENRVPFLDHALLEAIAAIPPAARGALLVDKAILRALAARVLPPDLAARPKGYFFYGRGEARAFALMHSILVRNGGELIEQAIAGSQATGGPLAADGLRRYAQEASAAPGIQPLAALLDLVNMGVLAEMAAAARPAPARASALPVAEIDFAAWSATPAAQASLRRARQRGLDDGLVLALADGYSIVRVDRLAAAQGATPPGTYVAHGLQLAPIVSEATAKAMALVDGRRTIGEILAEARVNRSIVMRQFATAIDEGVLIARDTPSP